MKLHLFRTSEFLVDVVVVDFSFLKHVNIIIQSLFFIYASVELTLPSWDTIKAVLAKQIERENSEYCWIQNIFVYKSFQFL